VGDIVPTSADREVCASREEAWRNVIGCYSENGMKERAALEGSAKQRRGKNELRGILGDVVRGVMTGRRSLGESSSDRSVPCRRRQSRRANGHEL